MYGRLGVLGRGEHGARHPADRRGAVGRRRALPHEVVRARCASCASEDRTIVLVSHALGTIEELCDQAIWMDKGELRMWDEPDAVVDAYTEFLEVGEDARHDGGRVDAAGGPRGGGGDRRGGRRAGRARPAPQGGGDGRGARAGGGRGRGRRRVRHDRPTTSPGALPRWPSASSRRSSPLVAVATLIRRRPEAFAAARRRSRCRSACPVTVGGETANLLLPLYGVIAAGVLAYACGGCARRRRARPTARDAAARRVGRLEMALAACSCSTRVQALYSSDLEQAVKNSCFFYVPFARALRGCCSRCRWTPRLLRAVLRADRRRSRCCSPPSASSSARTGRLLISNAKVARGERPQAVLPGQLAVLRPEHLRALPRADDDPAGARRAAVERRGRGRSRCSPPRSRCCGRGSCCRCRSRASPRCWSASPCSPRCAGGRGRWWRVVGGGARASVIGVVVVGPRARCTSRAARRRRSTRRRAGAPS